MNLSLFVHWPRRFVNLFRYRIPQGIQAARRWWWRQRLQAFVNRSVEVVADRTTPAVLFVTPEAGVGPHFATHCIVAKTLQEQGHRVLMTFCHEVFDRCPMMDMHRRPFDNPAASKAACCLNCVDLSRQFLAQYALPKLDLRQFPIAELKAKAHAALENLPTDWLDFEYDGIAFGKLAAMDLVLARKVSEFQRMDDESRTAWRTYIETCLFSFLLFDHIFSTMAIREVVHFNDYSLLLGARLAAERRGISVHGMTLAAHLNNDRRRVLIRKDVGPIEFRRVVNDWPRWRDFPLSRAEVEDVADDIVIRLQATGTHTFSSAKQVSADDPRPGWGLATDKKLIVAYTSSLDEMLATRMTTLGAGRVPVEPFQLFGDQIAWLKALMAFVSTNTEWQLAVRVHPREGGGGQAVSQGKVLPIASQHLLKLKEAFSQPTPNCKIFWPGDPVSSYDLGEAADVVVNSWTTVGLEMARLGVPVLSYTRNLGGFVWDDFIEGAETPDEYFEKLQAIERRPPTLETLARAFRFYHLAHLGNAIPYDDMIPRGGQLWNLPPFRKPLASRKIEQVFIEQADPMELRFQDFSTRNSLELQREEGLTLRTQLERLVRFLMTGCDENAGNHSANRVFVASPVRPGWVESHGVGMATNRYSPMVCRLLKLLQSPEKP